MHKKTDDDLIRVFRYSLDFYLKRFRFVFVFSIPFILAVLIANIVSAPTYFSLGALFVRTGSIPDLTLFDIVITAVAYMLSLFIIADVITNVNLVIRSARTLTPTKTEVIKALSSYAVRIFYIYIITVLLLFVLQLLTFDLPFQRIVYPALSFLLLFFLFFVPPAIVIDNKNTLGAVYSSITIAVKKPKYVFAWAVFGLFALSAVRIAAELFKPFAGEITLLLNSLFILPFLVVLQTHMYMEKYPLAK